MSRSFIPSDLRLRPFSHQPGICCLIPKTCWQAQFFPTQIHFKNLVNGQESVHPLPFKGPVKGFTVQLDLERTEIHFFGHAKEGYFSMRIRAENGRLLLNGVELFELDLSASFVTSKERLSFGVHKKQEWESMRNRLDPCELWPILFALAQEIPSVSEPPNVGSSVLLSACEAADKTDQYSLWQQVFLGCFQGLLVPSLSDPLHQGLFPEETIDSAISSIGLLYKAARLLRALFFEERADGFAILPQLPPECHAGRFIQLRTSEGHEIDLEWSKKSLKKAVVRPGKTGSVQLFLGPKIKSFRVRKNLKAKGQQNTTLQLELEQDVPLYLDRFL